MKRIAVTIMVLCALLIVNACGCGSPGRDVSTPRKALLGHWKNTAPGVDVEVYYSADTMTFSARGGRPISQQYEVVEEDQAEFTLKIRIVGGEDSEPFAMGFSADRTELLGYPARVPELLKYTYVDSKQHP